MKEAGINREQAQVFLDLKNWVGQNFPPHKIFKRHRPVCYILELVTGREPEKAIDYESYGLSGDLPFNSEQQGLENEIALGEIYENSARLGFIRDRAREAEAMGLRPSRPIKLYRPRVFPNWQRPPRRQARKP